MSDGQPLVDPFQNPEQFADLIRRLAETEAALQSALRGQIDAVFDPLSGAPLLLRQAQETLVKAEARYRRLLSRMAAVVFELAPDGTILYVNEAVLAVTGYTFSELVGQNWWAVLCPDALQPSVDSLSAQFQIGDVTGYELALRSKTGHLVTLELNSANWYQGDGKLTRILGLGIDITERRRSERAIQFLSEISAVLASSLDYQATLDKLVQLAVPRFADWCIVDWLNAEGTVERVALAHPDPEMVRLGQEYRQRYPIKLDDAAGPGAVIRTGEPEFVPEFSPSVQAPAARNADEQELIERLTPHSYMTLPLEARGQMLGALTFAMTDSPRRFTRADLDFAREFARRAALALDNARLYGAAEQAAARAARLQTITAGLSRALTPSRVADVILRQGLPVLQAVAGQTALLTHHGKMLEIVYATGDGPEGLGQGQGFPLDAPMPLTDAIRQGMPIWGGSWQGDESRASASATAGESWEGTAVVPLIVEGHIIGSMGLNFSPEQTFPEQDRTFIMTLAQQCGLALERARLYTQSQQQAETLQHRVDVSESAKTRMLANVTHEMRTPLSSIVGFSGLLLTRPFDAAKIREYVTNINNEGRRMIQLVNDFLDLQRIENEQEVFHFATLDLADLFHKILDAYHLDDKPPHTLHLDITTAAKVYADEERIHQVLLNLLSNATKYSPQGGRITLRLFQQADEVICSVQDEGLGIDPAELAHLFQHFQRGEMAEQLRIQGTGLGLALCKNIIQRHNGRIWAESAGEGHGATFYFALPIRR